jgi:urea carboxylase
MLNKILVANRGEIAVRIIKTIQKMGKTAVAIYNDADTNATHVLEANEAYFIGSGTVAETYLNTNTIFKIIADNKIDAVHPGYGLLSENSSFASELEAKGVVFLGPTPEQIDSFGLKHKAREIALKSQLPILSGSEILPSAAEACVEAAKVGYPVMLKSTGGGGGIGMQICYSENELTEAFESVVSLAQKNFSNGGVFIEKFLAKARHVEVQIFGDGKGGGMVLGDRDCSIQRRSQKIIEETPAPNIPTNVRNELYSCARRLMQYINYRSAGTIEFLYDEATQQFYFLEVNTRLQVEHTVTEEVFNIDIVEAMISLQEGTYSIPENPTPKGASIQFRLYAEDPYKNYMPSTGLITKLIFPKDIRVDSWIREGIEVSPFFDPLLAKIVIKAETREACVKKAIEVLTNTTLEGVETNLEFLLSIAKSNSFAQAILSTKFLDSHQYKSNAIDIITPGTFSTVQDFPGRTGYWQVGIPPSGPMDSFSFRIGNRMLGNFEEAAGLEITATGPKIKFRNPVSFVLTGATIDAVLNNVELKNHTVYSAIEGDVLTVGKISDAGQRSYLLLSGGIQISEYLGSKSTFSLGVMGGHCGRVLRPGDVLHLNATKSKTFIDKITIPALEENISIDVMYGPHGAPDFFINEGITEFLDATWGVHFNSSRTGVRLLGPSPKWAREDGGEAGLHPSNIHDNAYAIGAIDFTGDMPIILGPDGPSLGGFVCPFTIIKADLWKMGQLSVKSKIKFNVVTYEQASAKEKSQAAFLKNLKGNLLSLKGNDLVDLSPIIEKLSYQSHEVLIRQSGDDNILIELGKLELDIELRLIIHKLFEAFEKAHFKGIIDLTPGIRSLQIHFDPLLLERSVLIKNVSSILNKLKDNDDITVPSRIVYLPLSWNDPQAKLAMEKYQTTVRADAPWCPDNIEFIRRINGLNSIDEVQNIIFNANYLVMGLGDVYLGAPVATPLDPRQRLVTTKYNPARTWTPENAVGIGGAYMCVYGMEGPGGYQLFGRTLQMWNTYPKGELFSKEKPYLLRFFDQIKFFPVSADELLKIRRDFPQGRYSIKIEHTTFSLKEYKKFLAQNGEEINDFKQLQGKAFNDEKNDWIRTGKLNFTQDDPNLAIAKNDAIPEGSEGILSPISGMLWKTLVKVGDKIERGQALVILESMKMEFTIESEFTGVVKQINVTTGNEITAGDVICAIEVE